MDGWMGWKVCRASAFGVPGKKKQTFGRVPWLRRPPLTPFIVQLRHNTALKKDNRARNRRREGRWAVMQRRGWGETWAHRCEYRDAYRWGARDAGRVTQGDLDVLRRLAADGRVMSCRKKAKK